MVLTRPQLIVIPNVYNINVLFKVVDEGAEHKYDYKTMAHSSMKILPQDFTAYRLIRGILDKK